MRFAVLATALVVGVSCSSSSTDDPKVGADAGASDGARDGSKLPSCVGEGGYQCQPKGCLPGFEEWGGYDCGNSGGSCCAKSTPSSDSGIDSAVDARND